ncbi:MAG: hypothetical protein JNK65_02025 [Deltaproteobacteria bacterium]|nr:hypothetical protein [Deltaproteobacteria bacterium]
MSGIQFLIDKNGKKQAVVIDLKKHSEIWEDFYDLLLAKKRMNEPKESIESVRKKLQRLGKLS